MAAHTKITAQAQHPAEPRGVSANPIRRAEHRHGLIL
jgi:hypothetical protein